MAEVEKYGIDKVTEMALDQVDPHGNRKLQVSFDIDSLDTLEAPSTGCAGKVNCDTIFQTSVKVLIICEDQKLFEQ